MKLKDNDDHFKKSLKTEFVKQMDHYFEKFGFNSQIEATVFTTNGLDELSESLIASCTLDPKFKELRFLENTEEKKENFHKITASQLRSIWEIYKPEQTDVVSQPGNANKSDDDEKSIFSIPNRNASSYSNGTYLQELKHFCKFPQMEFTDFFQVFGHIFERLSQVASHLLCIPGSSVPCERLFSHAEFQVVLFSSRKKIY
jgi:hypothetical protein